MSTTLDPPPTRSLGRFNPEAWAARAGIHYGWVVVALTVLVLTTAAGVRSAPGVLIRPLEHDFAWSRGEISLAIALSLITYGLAAPLSARVTDRIGLRGMMLVFLLTSGIGLALSTTIGQLWQLHVLWGLIVGLGTGGVATVLGATVANTWFSEKRGLVVGLLSGAASAGTLIFLPLLVWITSEFGWRYALAALAVVVLGLILPLVFLFMRSRPTDVGLSTYGHRDDAPRVLADETVVPMRKALRTGRLLAARIDVLRLRLHDHRSYRRALHPTRDGAWLL